MNFRLSDDSFEVDIIGKEELNVVARLLGISTTLLWQGITTRTHTVRGQPVKSMSDANLVRTNSLFLAFYSKTLISFILLKDIDTNFLGVILNYSNILTKFHYDMIPYPYQ